MIAEHLHFSNTFCIPGLELATIHPLSTTPSPPRNHFLGHIVRAYKEVMVILPLTQLNLQLLICIYRPFQFKFDGSEY